MNFSLKLSTSNSVKQLNPAERPRKSFELLQLISSVKMHETYLNGGSFVTDVTRRGEVVGVKSGFFTLDLEKPRGKPRLADEIAALELHE